MPRSDTAPADPDSARITALCRYIEAADHLPTLAELARHAGLSPAHLHRLFKAGTGLTPRAYALAQRRQRLHTALERQPTVTAALYEAGFGSDSRLYEKTGELLGMTPGRYRAGGADTDIRFAVGQCSLGSLLVACSAHGICAIALGDDADVVGQFQQRAHALAHQGLIVHEANGNHRAPSRGRKTSSAKPRAISSATERWPPYSERRSRMPRRPLPSVVSSLPRPSSRARRAMPSSSRVSVIHRLSASAWRTALVMISCTQRRITCARMGSPSAN